MASSADNDPRSDAELLAATPHDARAFAVFYRRHVGGVLLFFRAHRQQPEVAADLMAETFAGALVAARRYRPRKASPTTWLYAIARNKLVDAYRRGRVRDQARGRLGMERLALDDEDLARVDELAGLGAEDAPALAALRGLTEDQRAAVVARVLEERSYAEIAEDLRCSPAVARKRVSRGLDAIRIDLEGTP